MHSTPAKRIISTLIAFTSFFLADTGFAAPLDQPSNVGDFLKNQKTIRIWVDAGMGFGDIAATANIMTRIRQSGFQGKFEAVYDTNGGGQEGKDRIISLFGLPKNMSDDYYDVNSNIRFIRINVFFDQLVNKSIDQIDISAGDGISSNFCKLVLIENPDDAAAKKMKNSITCTNDANFFNSRIFAGISNWPTPLSDQSEYKDDLIVLSQFNNKTTQSIVANYTYYATPVATLADAENFLNNNPDGLNLLSQKPALTTFINGIKNQNFNVLATYGHPVHSESGDKQYIGNILKIISGARYAQMNSAGSIHDKPLVIAMFYDYQNEAAQLNKIIQNDDWSDISDQQGAELIKQTVKQLDLRSVFSIASVSDPNTVITLQHLKSGQILLLYLGSLPKDVFDGLFTHTGDNIWPQIREGASSLSSLLLTGRPHFRCGDQLVANEGGVWEMSFANVKDADLKSRLEQFYSNDTLGYPYFCGGIDWQTNPNAYQVLGKFIIEAQDKSSPFSQYFQDIKTDASNIEKDRVYVAMQKSIEILNGTPAN